MVVSPDRWGHLLRRFTGTITAWVDPSRLRMLERYLTTTEQALFLTMNVSDQRHSLDLCGCLERDGQRDSVLLVAALLHDVGKGQGRLPLPYRVAYSLLATTLPTIAAQVGQSDTPAWRRPFYLAAHHPEIGARAAAAAGSDPQVVRLIAGHASPGDDVLSQILYTYDRGM